MTPYHASDFFHISPATRMWLSADVVYSHCSHFSDPFKNEKSAPGPNTDPPQTSLSHPPLHVHFSSQELGLIPTPTSPWDQIQINFLKHWHSPSHNKLCSSLLVMTPLIRSTTSYEYKYQGHVTEPIEGCQNSPPVSHLRLRNFGRSLFLYLEPCRSHHLALFP